jgi:hypothetical protein
MILAPLPDQSIWKIKGVNQFNWFQLVQAKDIKEIT